MIKARPKKWLKQIVAGAAALAIFFMGIPVPETIIPAQSGNQLPQLRWQLRPLDLLIRAEEDPTHNGEADSSTDHLEDATRGDTVALPTVTHQISFVRTDTREPVGPAYDVSRDPVNFPDAHVSSKSKFDIMNNHKNGQSTGVAEDYSQTGEYKAVQVKDFPPGNASTEDLDNFFRKDGYHNIGNLVDEMISQGADLGMPKEELIAGIKDGSIALAYEPRVWFTFYGQTVGLTAAQIGGMAADADGHDMFRPLLGNLTNNTLLNMIRLAFPDGMTEMLGINMMNALAKGQYADFLAMIYGSGGLGLVYDQGSYSCCGHQPDCPCGQGPDCTCFSGHLSGPNPVPCGPGVPDCPCVPEEPCCNHPPTCPCDPGNHPDNDPNCTCPDDHPGSPCGPDEPNCKCFDPETKGELPTSEDELVIKEDEMMQAFTIDLKAQPSKKFEATPAPRNSSDGEYVYYVTEPGDCDEEWVGKPPHKECVGSHGYQAITLIPVLRPGHLCSSAFFSSYYQSSFSVGLEQYESRAVPPAF